jgi:flavoprotein
MALKTSIPVFIMPSDYDEGEVVTKLPNEKTMKIKIRREDVENVKKLERMSGVFVIKTPNEIYDVLTRHLKIRI